MKKILLIALVGLIILLPSLVQAGLVPCGLAEDDLDQEGDQTVPCTICHLFLMLSNIIKFVMFKIVPPLAALMLIVGGIMFFFAGTNPEMFNQAKSIIISVAIGLGIVFGAWVIVNTILVESGIVEGGALLEWWKISCE